VKDDKKKPAAGKDDKKAGKDDKKAGKDDKKAGKDDKKAGKDDKKADKKKAEGDDADAPKKKEKKRETGSGPQIYPPEIGALQTGHQKSSAAERQIEISADAYDLH